MPQAKVLLARAPDPQCPKWVRFQISVLEINLYKNIRLCRNHATNDLF